MSLKRKEIRAKIVEMLSGETDAGTRVYPSRIFPVWQKDLPAILVYTPADTREIDAQPRKYAVDLQIRVEILQKAKDSIDDELDALASQVEYVLAQDFSLGDNVEELVQEGTEITVDKDGDELLGSVVLSFKARYYQSSVTDPIFLDDLKTVQTDWQADGATSASMDTEDTVTGLVP